MVPANSYRASPTPQYSGYHYVCKLFHIRDYHPLWSAFPNLFYYALKVNVVVLQPPSGRNQMGLGCFAFARHYLRNHYYFLLLRLLRCFSSAGLLLFRDDIPSVYRVAPFRNLRINVYLPLPEAYRSLSRLSSPPRSKASSIRP